MALDRSPKTPPARFSLADATLADLEAMRLLLEGSSAIDAHRLAFTEAGEIDRFLRVNGFDPDDENDLNRLEELREQAVDYLHRVLDYPIPSEVGEGIPVPELLLLA